MAIFEIWTDAAGTEIEASSADEAAAKFAREGRLKGVKSVSDLEAYLERVGGYGTMTAEDGSVVFEVSE